MTHLPQQTNGVKRLTHDYTGLLSISESLNVAGDVLGLLNLALRNPRITLIEMALILRRDVVLSARVIRIANTAFFFKTSRICNTIEEALQRVGLREVCRIIAAATLQGKAPAQLRAYGISSAQFNKSTRFTATACQLIAAEVNVDAHLAYLSGLVRPLGIMVLNQWSETHCTDVDKLSWRNPGSLLNWESQTFGVNHLDVSCFIAREWGMPASVSESIEKSIDPFAYVQNSPLPLILQTAEALAESNRATFQAHHEISPLNQESLIALGIKPSKLFEISREALRQSQQIAG
jgi:HD-like signal output (HDOD) protein